LATVLQNLGKLYYVQGAYAETELFYQRSLAIWEEAKWPQDRNAAKALENYALLLRKTGRESTAVSLEAHAQAIRAEILNSSKYNNADQRSQ
jgi:tetratricopeptide repeat protein